MSATIVQDPGTGSVVGFSNNGVVGTAVQLSNQDDTGVLGWEWVIVDRPAGSVAALDDENSATPQYTPDVAGTYLIELTTYTDAGRTTVDDTNQTATGVPLAGIFNVDWRIPAATETVEASATRGWAVEVNEILKEAAKHLYVGHFDSPITAAQSPYSPQSYETVPVDTTGGAVTVDLPAVAAANKGHRILVHDVGRAAAQITIAPNGSDTIAGAASSIAIAGTGLEGDFRWLQSDGSGGWDLVGGIAVVALQDLESVLTEGANATDIGITNLGGASITSGQAVTFLGEIDIRNATPRLYTLGGNTRIEAPLGQVVQAFVDNDRIVNFYKDLISDGGNSDLFGISISGTLGGTSVFYGDEAPAGANGPDMLIKGHDAGDDGSTATDGGDILWRPGGPKQGGAGGRVVMQGHNATDLLAASVAGGLEASTRLTLSLTGIATAQTPGATLRNTTAATAGTPQQYSPMHGFLAHGWDGSAADVTIESAWQLQPLGTDTGGTSNHKLLARTGGSGAWQEVGRFAFEAGDPTTEPAFLLNGSVNSHVRFGAPDVNSSQPAPGARLQCSANAGTGDDGDAGVYDAAGNPRIYHDASESKDKIGDLTNGALDFDTLFLDAVNYWQIRPLGGAGYQNMALRGGLNGLLLAKGGNSTASGTDAGDLVLEGGDANSSLGGANGANVILRGGTTDAGGSGGSSGSVRLQRADGSSTTLEVDGVGRLGFFGATPAGQKASSGETAGFTAGTGTGVNDDSTFTGNVGTDAYTIGDIVKHLKAFGFLRTSP